MTNSNLRQSWRFLMWLWGEILFLACIVPFLKCVRHAQLHDCVDTDTVDNFLSQLPTSVQFIYIHQPRVSTVKWNKSATWGLNTFLFDLNRDGYFLGLDNLATFALWGLFWGKTPGWKNSDSCRGCIGRSDAAPLWCQKSPALIIFLPPMSATDVPT